MFSINEKNYFSQSFKSMGEKWLQMSNLSFLRTRQIGKQWENARVERKAIWFNIFFIDPSVSRDRFRSVAGFTQAKKDKKGAKGRRIRAILLLINPFKNCCSQFFRAHTFYRAFKLAAYGLNSFIGKVIHQIYSIIFVYL